MDHDVFLMRKFGKGGYVSASVSACNANTFLICLAVGNYMCSTQLPMPFLVAGILHVMPLCTF